MIGIRAAKGLGDAIHLRAAVLHLLSRRNSIKVFTKWPIVFSGLSVRIASMADGDRHEGLMHFGYKIGRDEDISNFTSACQRAGILDPVELRIDWRVQNQELVNSILQAAAGRKIFVYQTRKVPKNEAQELLRPNLSAYNGFIAAHREYFRVRLGEPPYCEDDRSAPCELDLLGKASIADALDIGTIGDLFFGESCYVPMVGEAMDKRYAIMFTRRALMSDCRIKNMTPVRLFHKKHLATAVYDES